MTHPLSEAGTSVEVKRLEWRPSETDAELAMTVVGEYSVFVSVDDERGEWWEAWRERAYLSAWATEDEAKAAAQADYRQRILSALIQPTPAETEGGEVLVSRELLAQISLHLEEWPGDDDLPQREKAARLVALIDSALAARRAKETVSHG